MNGPVWRKSMRSGGQQGDCVELARIGAGVGIRDGKNPAAGHLSIPVADFAALLRRIKSGRIDL